MDDDSVPAPSRRTVLSSLAGSATFLAVGQGTALAQDAGEGYHLEQGDLCLELEPLSGDQSPADLYDWDVAETLYSSEGTTDLQQPDTSILFLYEDPEGTVSLVLVHGQFGGDHDGGSATFEFTGLPADGDWTVQDDNYDGPSNYDNWDTGDTEATVDWTWASARTDGGVYGPLGDGLELTIEPAFNGDATLDGEYYDGTVDDWQVLTGDRDDPDRTSLTLDEPIRIRAGACPDDEDEDEDEEEREDENEDEEEREDEDEEVEKGDDDDSPGRGPPDDVPSRGPPESDEVPGRGPPDRNDEDDEDDD